MTGRVYPIWATKPAKELTGGLGVNTGIRQGQFFRSIVECDYDKDTYGGPDQHLQRALKENLEMIELSLQHGEKSDQRGPSHISGWKESGLLVPDLGEKSAFWEFQMRLGTNNNGLFLVDTAVVPSDKGSWDNAFDKCKGM